MLNITVFTNRLLLLLGINIFTLHLICFNLLIPPLETTALNLPQTLLFSFITMIYKKTKKKITTVSAQSQCGDCVLAPGDSDLSSFIPVSTGVDTEFGNTELFGSIEEEAAEGRDTTMYFCIGREAVSPGPLPDSSFTKGCKVDVALGTVLVTGEADWEELMVITWKTFQTSR